MISELSEEQIKQAALKLVMDRINTGKVNPNCRQELRVAIRQARKLVLASLEAASRVVNDAENALASVQAGYLPSSTLYMGKS
ncbi:hypothetical protein [Pseudomonas luteola]|uniref:hypothetical protein n=1 Tax=Pseudomonas luteola TaxID=47886 RepID=UPI000F7A7310|nr:hypothetical protein [Pseudomonas luteola]